MSEEQNLHAEHRLRLKTRFLRQGMDDFSDHEILELLLFYALPRRDTNEIGHRLMARFKTLSGVFDASLSELCEVEGISEHSATLIKMIPALAKAYYVDSQNDRMAFDDYAEVGRYFTARFVGSKNEELYAAYLDNKHHLIECRCMQKGTVNSAGLSIRQLVAACVELNASAVVLAHNHPHGVAIPSGDDLSVTNALVRTLQEMDIRLLEHYIVSGDTYVGILKKRFGNTEGYDEVQ